MKVYFEKNDGRNLVIITDGETAKIFDAAPTGIYDGVDLYAEDAADKLRESFQELERSGELSTYYEIYSPDEVIFDDIKDELEEYAELIFESGTIEIPKEMIAEYLIESFSSMYEDGYYYVHWNPETGLNYKGNDDPENITVCVKCDYAEDLDRYEFDSKESYDDHDFMEICEKLADLLNEKIQTQREVDND